MTKCSETRREQCRQSPKACRNHTAAWRMRRPRNSPILCGRGAMRKGKRGYQHSFARTRPGYKSVERDESRRQYIVPGDHLRGSDPRIAAAVRLGAEHRDLCRGVVGLCRPAARRLGHAVRHVRFGLRSDLDRSRQCDPVHRLRGDLDRRAGVRSSQAAMDPAVRRRRALARAVPHPGDPRLLGPAYAALIGHHHRLHLGDGLRVLARPQRAVGVALAGDLHAVRPRRALSVAHAVRRHAGAGEQRGVRQRLAHRAQLRGAAVHHRHRLHPAGHGEGAHRVPSQDGFADRSADRHRQPPRLPAGRRSAAQAAGDRSAADGGDAARSR